MKHFLLLITIVFCISNVSSQIIYQQDFSNGKGDMIIIDNDKRMPQEDVLEFAGAWVITDAKSAGDPAAINNSFYTPVGKADDWLITPIIKGINEKMGLSWSAQALNKNFPNGYEVRVSPTGGDKISDFTDLLITIEKENTALTSRSVILEDYVGKDIRIAFHDNSNNKQLLLLDNILLTKIPDLDAEMKNVITDQYALVNEDAKIYYEVKNLGYDEISTFEVEVSDGINTKTEKVNGAFISFGDTYQGLVTFKISSAEKVNVTAKILSINNVSDPNPNNNTANGSLQGVSKKINKKLVAEEATGTWCPWCTRGTVFMEKMKKDFPDNFIGIAVHNGDPMVVASYDNGIKTLPRFSGYPSVAVNRQLIIDPEEMPKFLADFTSREVSPFEINVRQSKVNRKITVNGDITFFTSLPDADFNVVVAMVEDGVRGTASGYNQANAYAGGNAGLMGGYEKLPNPVPASQMVYNEVGRALPFGFRGKSGIIPSNIKEGDVFSFSVDYECPSTENIDNIHTVAFVVNNKTGHIINGAKTQSFAVNVADIKELDHVSIFPNPTFNVSYINLNLNTAANVDVRVINNMGQIMASKDYGKLSGLQLLPMHTDNYMPGIYYVQIMVNGKVTTQKLLVD
jgi:hypothetical protein